MAITSYKQIGIGVFGLQGLVDQTKATPANLGYILSGINMSGESDNATIQDGFGAVVSSTKFNSRMTLSFDGYYTNSTDIPKIGDVVELDADLGLTLPDITINGTGSAIPAYQIQNVELVATNSDYVTVSISADFYPELPYIPAP